MPQQLNLYDPRLEPPRLRLKARHAGLAAAGTALAMFIAAQALDFNTRRSLAQAASLGQQTQAERAQLLAHSGGALGLPAPAALAPAAGAVSGPAASAAVVAPRAASGAPDARQQELASLQSLDAGQRRILEALDAGVAGVRQGPAGYLEALARRADANVWITAFGVAENGQDLSLEGRMLDASALPDYLRHLNNEARFAGRPFAQLTLNTPTAPGGGNGGGAGAELRITEFALRTTPLAGKAR